MAFVVKRSTEISPSVFDLEFGVVLKRALHHPTAPRNYCNRLHGDFAFFHALADFVEETGEH